MHKSILNWWRCSVQQKPSQILKSVFKCGLLSIHGRYSGKWEYSNHENVVSEFHSRYSSQWKFRTYFMNSPQNRSQLRVPACDVFLKKTLRRSFFTFFLIYPIKFLSPPYQPPSPLRKHQSQVVIHNKSNKDLCYNNFQIALNFFVTYSMKSHDDKISFFALTSWIQIWRKVN